MPDNSNPQAPVTHVRLASMQELRSTFLPNFFSPVPPAETLRDWFAHLPQFKANPVAKRGGGRIFYSIPAVERFIRSRIISNE